jgi:hypothetical protein
MGIGMLAAPGPLMPMSILPLPTIQEAIPAVPILADLVKGGAEGGLQEQTEGQEAAGGQGQDGDEQQLPGADE